MRIIHCADLHLDSKMETHLGKDKARERKAELLKTFEKIVDTAEEKGAAAVIIAGDLFDRKSVSATAKNTVFNIAQNHRKITFFYLRGNHDISLELKDSIPDNIKLFGSDWTTYDVGERVRICGTELDKNPSSDIYERLVLDADKINIVTLHGMEDEYGKKSDAKVIGFNSLRGKNIDYLALGHVHTYKVGKLDARGIYCYSGCPEGRGFDECGEKGVVLLDINEETGEIAHEFLPIAARTIHDVCADISDCETTTDIIGTVKKMTADIPSSDIVKITLCGRVSVECEKNTELIRKQFEEDFYYVRVKDETKFRIDYESFKNDMSLKGEFVRCVMASDISDDDKAAVIRYGIQALMGEDMD